MPGAGAQSAQGTLFQIKISGVYTTVVGRTKITPPNRTRTKIEATDLDSDDDESIPGAVRHNGEYEIEGNLIGGAASQEYLEDSYDAGDMEEAKHILTNGTVYSYDCWIMELQIGEAAVDGKQTFKAKVCVTGAITKS